MPESSQEISHEQLAKHNTLDSLWIAVQGHVYDLTDFSPNHPGGIEALESCAGADGTESYEYAGHSESNMAKMQQYRVGRLSGSLDQTSTIVSNPMPVESKPPMSAVSRTKKPKLPSWAGLIAAVSCTSLIAFLSYQRGDGLLERIRPAMNTTDSRLKGSRDEDFAVGFWAGIMIASLGSCAGMGYLYMMFMSTLDYKNEVFSFPPTIPRKSRK